MRTLISRLALAAAALGFAAVALAPEDAGAAAAGCTTPGSTLTGSGYSLTVLAPTITGFCDGSLAFGVSGDGSRVAGENNVNGAPSFIAAIWQNGVWYPLTDGSSAIGGNSFSRGMSDDGNVIVGYYGPGNFRWDYAGPGPGDGAVTTIPTFVGSLSRGLVTFNLQNSAIESGMPLSRDGTTIVGTAQTAGGLYEAFLWRCTPGPAPACDANLTSLGVPTGYTQSSAFGVNASSTAVVGQAVNAAGSAAAFYWSQPSGSVVMPNPAGLTGEAIARGINDAGTVAVGSVNTVVGPGAQMRASIWGIAPGVNPSFSPVNLASFGGPLASANSQALAVNGAGTMVVGDWFGPVVAGTSSGAFLWSGSAMQDVRSLLLNAGVNLTGIDIQSATAVSRDGQFITLRGSTPTFSQLGLLMRIVSATPSPPLPTAQTIETTQSTTTQPTTTQPTTQPEATQTTQSLSNQPLIVGLTTPSSLIQSAQNLAQDRQTQMVTNRVLTSVLQGINEQVNCSSPCVSGFGSFGSFSAGVHGRTEIVRDVTMIGGVAFARSERNGVEMKDTVLGALALRFDPADWGPSRPFAEVGGTLSPRHSVRYSRPYQNGAGIATGVGDTTVTNYAGFARLGFVHRPSPIDEFAVSTEVWTGRQAVSGYAEPLSSFNPFNAQAKSGADSMNLVRAGGQYTRLLLDWVEMNMNGGVVRSFGTKSGLALTVAGAGEVRPTLKEATWGELGGRLGFRIAARTVIDIFANGTVGPKPIGDSIHVGGGLRVTF